MSLEQKSLEDVSLEHAAPHIQLAVDLIELLEINQQPPERVLAALALVQRDYQRKLAALQPDASQHATALSPEQPRR